MKKTIILTEEQVDSLWMHPHTNPVKEFEGCEIDYDYSDGSYKSKSDYYSHFRHDIIDQNGKVIATGYGGYYTPETREYLTTEIEFTFTEEYLNSLETESEDYYKTSI